MPRIEKTRFGRCPASVNALKRRSNERRVQKREELPCSRVVVSRRIAAEIRFDRDLAFRRIQNRPCGIVVPGQQPPRIVRLQIFDRFDVGPWSMSPRLRDERNVIAPSLIAAGAAEIERARGIRPDVVVVGDVFARGNHRRARRLERPVAPMIDDEVHVHGGRFLRG